ncbi:RNA polymerase, sigma 28 subunit, FliA/WhiG subfamily [Thioalkalivibrio sp. K90mix]|jgi:RNA polymerase sigma factor for flagellar operon FliA|uniref:RNA polymerase sigma factor FliA n=1 Tax=unclassified Thioalkalivibrio TaxID=2621013 RepID=UPI0001C4E1E0|nr:MULTISPECIES: RNA polymerase sigma factor FliA [unclassified Thioalkalivibrio]ADC71684.1 RNA polymerase, sigma 28 subunit, FliA/WhiG subfamily [Thioalkalivibrio sp. K90mix]
MMSPRNRLPGYESVAATGHEQRVAEHIELVHRIAHHLMARLPSSVQVDDLIQAGMIGLLEAARQFEGGQGATFATYAGIRIRGAMIDELRRSDWTPRSVHRNSRKIAEAIQTVEAREGRAARGVEVAEELEVPIDEYYSMLQDHAGAHLFALDDLGGTDGDADRVIEGQEASPSRTIEAGEFREELAAALGDLPERERLVLSLYYIEELNLREIGAVLGVTESRVSQIRSQAVIRLRARLGSWLEDGEALQLF